MSTDSDDVTVKASFAVIFHADCQDGFGAAWAVHRYLRQGAAHDKHVVYLACSYHDPAPDFEDMHVIIVDFSFKRPALEKLASRNRSVTVLDHHRTAEQELQGFPEAKLESFMSERISTIFDMKRSGTMIAWNFFHPDREPPDLVKYIQDRDLWTKELVDSDSYHHAVMAIPNEFDAWDRLAELSTVSMIGRGDWIQLWHRQRISETIRRQVRMTTLLGHDCVVCNVPKFMVSDLSQEMLLRFTEAKFAVCWLQLSSGEYEYHLRSRGDFDVSEIAKRYGGGGHAAAAGFVQSGPPLHPMRWASDAMGTD